ncbi:hypothetical protein [Deinococcus misasensis]|uniref:hypothetical protein n=1 Tax=Deinococcus misasensis TaxID=392413 RepID=UPI0005593936|nr:hypothetical protein [Deinococcus misasensis]
MNDNTIEAHVLYPTLGGVMCARLRILNGARTEERMVARVQGYSFPPRGQRVTLQKDPLTGEWVVGA